MHRTAAALPPPHIESLVTAIQPSVEASNGMPGDAVENAVVAHIRGTVAALKGSGPVLADAVMHGRLKIVGAEYRLANGRVDFMA
jgi:carbonic anhydrase